MRPANGRRRLALAGRIHKIIPDHEVMYMDYDWQVFIGNASFLLVTDYDVFIVV